jgi:hypothetical protein
MSRIFDKWPADCLHCHEVNIALVRDYVGVFVVSKQSSTLQKPLNKLLNEYPYIIQFLASSQVDTELNSSFAETVCCIRATGTSRTGW